MRPNFSIPGIRLIQPSRWTANYSTPELNSAIRTGCLKHIGLPIQPADGVQQQRSLEPGQNRARIPSVVGPAQHQVKRLAGLNHVFLSARDEQEMQAIRRPTDETRVVQKLDRVLTKFIGHQNIASLHTTKVNIDIQGHTLHV